jgi:hypothetical protein
MTLKMLLSRRPPMKIKMHFSASKSGSAHPAPRILVNLKEKWVNIDHGPSFPVKNWTLKSQEALDISITLIRWGTKRGMTLTIPHWTVFPEPSMTPRRNNPLLRNFPRHGDQI